MLIVYATGIPGYLEFHLAHDRKGVPQNSIILAICNGEHREDYLDDYTCRTMTDGEYYALQTSINLAQGLEFQRLQRLRNSNIFHRALMWLTSLLPGKQPAVNIPRS